MFGLAGVEIMKKKYFWARLRCTDPNCHGTYLASSSNFRDPITEKDITRTCIVCEKAPMRLAHDGEMGLPKTITKVECPACYMEQHHRGPMETFTCVHCGYKAIDIKDYIPDYRHWGRPHTSRGKFHHYSGKLKADCGYDNTATCSNDGPKKLGQVCKHCLAKLKKK